jgi:hypothetical protein
MASLVCPASGGLPLLKLLWGGLPQALLPCPTSAPHRRTPDQQTTQGPTPITFAAQPTPTRRVPAPGHWQHPAGPFGGVCSRGGVRLAGGPAPGARPPLPAGAPGRTPWLGGPPQPGHCAGPRAPVCRLRRRSLLSAAVGSSALVNPDRAAATAPQQPSPRQHPPQPAPGRARPSAAPALSGCGLPATTKRASRSGAAGGLRRRGRRPPAPRGSLPFFTNGASRWGAERAVAAAAAAAAALAALEATATAPAAASAAAALAAAAGAAGVAGGAPSAASPQRRWQGWRST